MTVSPRHLLHQGIQLLRQSIPVFFVFLFLIHSAIILAIGHYHDPHLWENGVIATYLWKGQGFAAGFSIPDELTSWQAPGYPYLLLGFWSVLGRTSTAFLFLSLLQAAALASVFIPLEQLTERWFGPRTKCFVRPLVLVMPLYYWYATRLHHTAFVMALHPWLIWGWLWSWQKPLSWPHIFVGIGTGVAGLFQPVLLGIFGGLSASLLIFSFCRRETSAGIRILLMGGLTLLVLLPWTVRNYRVHHRLLVIKDSFGKEFWMGNNPHATGTGYALGGEEDIALVYPPKVWSHAGTYTEIEMMDALQKEGMDYIKAEPRRFVKRTLQKILWFWTLTPSDRVRSHGGGEALVFRWLHAGYWFTFLGLMTLGLARGGRWKAEYAALLLFYVLLYSAVYGLTHVGQARFRGEIEFIFLPAVASGLAMIFSRFSPSPPAEIT
jgi:hypothetical protein